MYFEDTGLGSEYWFRFRVLGVDIRYWFRFTVYGLDLVLGLDS